MSKQTYKIDDCIKLINRLEKHSIEDIIKHKGKLTNHLLKIVETIEEIITELQDVVLKNKKEKDVIEPLLVYLTEISNELIHIVNEITSDVAYITVEKTIFHLFLNNSSDNLAK